MKTISTLMFLLLLSCVTGSSQVLTCGPENISELRIQKGESTYICVNVNNQHRVLFLPQVDDFTELRLESSSEHPVWTAPNRTYVSISSLTEQSFTKIYRDVETNRVFALLTAIVSVKAGQVQGITWDDGCFFCPEAQCAAQNLYLQPDVPTSVASSATCFASQEQCTLEERHCDLVIYLGWTGTDVDGNYLSSAGLRFSQFQSYSVQSYYNSFKARLDSTVSAISK